MDQNSVATQPEPEAMLAEALQLRSISPKLLPGTPPPLPVLRHANRLAKTSPIPGPCARSNSFHTRPNSAARFDKARFAAIAGDIPKAIALFRNNAPDDWTETQTPFLALALDIIIAGFNGDFDVPELWREIAQRSKDEQLALSEKLRNEPLPASMFGLRHPKSSIAGDMIRMLVDFHAGLLDGPSLLDFSEATLLRHSQAPLAAGYVFHARHLLDPGNPKYDLNLYTCTKPFRNLDVLENGSHLCCACWLKKSVGTLSTTPPGEVWNSSAAVSIRESVMDGTFRYCNKVTCPLISTGTVPTKEKLREDPKWAGILDHGSGRIDLMPEIVGMHYDRQCNLACPSCRTGFITNNTEKQKQLDAITTAVFPLLATAKEAFVTGSGDPFASRTFRKFLAWVSDENCPKLKIILHTNGMLFTEEEWSKYPNLSGKVSIVHVSLDGATKETHERLRKGSRWEVMMNNLPFIGQLRAKAEIGDFNVKFVVQKDNFREMGEFVDLAHKIGANLVTFVQMTNWGTFSDEEFADKAVHSRLHPRHQEFLDAMSDPRLRDPIVRLTSLEEFLPKENHDAGTKSLMAAA